jgi:predicted ArsR family transcriptional regulator
MRGGQLARELRLIELLHTDGWQSLHALASKTGVTVRTVRRDLESLEAAQFAVVNIKNDDGVRRWKLRRGVGCPLCGRPLSLTPNRARPHDAVPDRPTARQTSPRA